MPWFRVFVSLAVAAVLACEGRKRSWRGSASCACTQVDGGRAATSYFAADVCAVDEPDCAPSQAKCVQLLAGAGCNTIPTAAACTFDGGWDYCDPYAPCCARE